jgi:hypothetical protein
VLCYLFLRNSGRSNVWRDGILPTRFVDSIFGDETTLRVQKGTALRYHIAFIQQQTLLCGIIWRGCGASWRGNCRHNSARNCGKTNHGFRLPKKRAERRHHRSRPSEVLAFLQEALPMFKDLLEVERSERDQDADTARIHAAVDAAEAAITVLAARHLGPDETRAEWSAIRDRTVLAIRKVRHNVIARANSAKQTEQWMVRKWLREVNDGRIMREFTADLQEVPTGALLDYLRYLIQFGDLARIQSVNAVFAARVDNRRYRATFDKMLGRFTLSQCGAIGARIARIHDLAEMVDARIAHLFSADCTTGRSRSRGPQSLPRVEGPSIGALDVDVGLRSERRGAIQLLQKRSAYDDLSRRASPLAPAAQKSERLPVLLMHNGVASSAELPLPACASPQP